MKQSTLLYIIFFVGICAIFSCIFPYPIFSNYNNITEKDASEINNYFETELNSSTIVKPNVLTLSWFNIIDNMFEIGKKYEIIDLQSEESFYITRTGGKNHADIEASNFSDFQIIHKITDNNFELKHLPVLLKLNENTYIPASLCCYPHGYNNSNVGYGHFCLHFKNSRTNFTNKIDSNHQKTVKIATKMGKSFIKLQ